MSKIRVAACGALFAALITLEDTPTVFGAEVTPTDWPAQCRWPDRVLEDGTKVNLRPLFNWLAQERIESERQSREMKLRNTPTSKLSAIELRELNALKARGPTPKKPLLQNPLPNWLLVTAKASSIRGDAAIAIQVSKVVVGHRKIKQGDDASVGGFYGAGGTRDASTPIYQNEEKPILVLNHPSAKTWPPDTKIPAFYALKVGNREIEWQGQKLAVDVYDHGKPYVSNQ